MSDELTREQVRARLNVMLQHVQQKTHAEAILAAFDAQRDTIERLEAVPPEIQQRIKAETKTGMDVSTWPAAVDVLLNDSEIWSKHSLTELVTKVADREARLAAVTAEKKRLETEALGLHATLAAVTAETRDAVDAAKEEAAGLRMRLATVTKERDAAMVKVRELEARVNDLKQRNQILRTRPDLPMTDPQKALFKQAEQRVAQLEEALRDAISLGEEALRDAISLAKVLEQQRDEALAKVRGLKEVIGLDCGDHSCAYAATKTGMRTNGGCRCKPQTYQHLRQRVAQLEGVLKDLLDDCCDMDQNRVAIVQAQQALQPPAPTTPEETP